jgi:hypothetical protein
MVEQCPECGEFIFSGNPHNCAKSALPFGYTLEEDMGNVTESIFSGNTVVIPMAEVQYIERDKREGFTDAISVILSGTTWSNEIDAYNNSAYLRGEEAEAFLRDWCRYRHELEENDLADLAPSEIFPGTMEALDKLGV